MESSSGAMPATIRHYEVHGEALRPTVPVESVGPSGPVLRTPNTLQSAPEDIPFAIVPSLDGQSADPAPEIAASGSEKPSPKYRVRRTIAAIGLTIASMGTSSAEPINHDVADAHAATPTISAEAHRQGVIESALAKETCSVRVDTAAVLRAYDNVYGGTDPTTLDDNTFVRQLGQAVDDWQRAREALTFISLDAYSEQLLLLSGDEVAKRHMGSVNISHVLTLGAWGVGEMSDWPSDPKKLYDTKEVDKGIEPNTSDVTPAQVKMTMVHIMGNLAMLPKEINEGGLINKIVEGTVSSKLAGGYVTNDVNVYIDTARSGKTTGTHEIGHKYMHEGLCNRDYNYRVDGAWQALMPAGINYAQAPMNVEGGITNYLKDYMVDRGYTSIDSQELATGKPKLRDSLFPIISAKAYGLNTLAEDQATLFEDLLNPASARDLLADTSRSEVLNIKVALTLARMREVNPRLATYVTAMLRAHRLDIEANRRTETGYPRSDYMLQVMFRVSDVISKGAVDPSRPPVAATIAQYTGLQLCAASGIVYVDAA